MKKNKIRQNGEFCVVFMSKNVKAINQRRRAEKGHFFPQGQHKQKYFIFCHLQAGHKTQVLIGWKRSVWLFLRFFRSLTLITAAHTRRAWFLDTLIIRKITSCAHAKIREKLFFPSSGHRNDEKSFYLRLLFNYEEVRDVRPQLTGK